MLDLEVAFIENHEEVLDIVQDMTFHAISEVYKNHADDLKTLNTPELVLKPKFPRYSVAEIHDLFSKATGKDTTKEKIVKVYE